MKFPEKFLAVNALVGTWRRIWRWFARLCLRKRLMLALMAFKLHRDANEKNRDPKTGKAFYFAYDISNLCTVLRRRILVIGREIAAALSDLSQWVTTIETSRSNHVTVQVRRLSSLILPGYLHTSLYDCKLFNSTRSIKSNPGLSIFFLELQNHAIANEDQNIIYTCFFFIIRATSRFG